jgi:hypothetical protein
MLRVDLNRLCIALLIFISFTLLVFCSTQPTPVQSPLYPSSPVIESISWDFNSLTRAAPGSDLWPLTWADDGHLYTTWGDGGGFGGTNDDGRVKLGVARIEGPGDNWQGFNTFGGKDPEAPATFEGKANAIIAIDGVLYMLVTEQDQWMRGKIGRSTDQGRTWTFNSGSFQQSGWDFDEPGGAFASGAFLQFGQDYQGARDDYVYLYSEKVRNIFQPDLLLARVLKTQIMDRNAYEFFTGLDGNGNPVWTANVNQAQAVFSDPNGLNWGLEAMYHPVLDRYLLTVRHDDSGGWAIFDAPEPWGPWTTVAYYDHWLDSTMKFMFSFNQKWMSSDGKTMWLAFSGTDEYDSFNVIKATLTLK